MIVSIPNTYAITMDGYVLLHVRSYILLIRSDDPQYTEERKSIVPAMRIFLWKDRITIKRKSPRKVRDSR